MAASSLPNSSSISIRCSSTARSARRLRACLSRNSRTSVRAAAWCLPSSSVKNEPQKSNSHKKIRTAFYVPLCLFVATIETARARLKETSVATDDDDKGFEPQDERRNHDRSRLIVDVFFDGKDITGVASTKDISPGGFYMNTQTDI